MSMKLNITWHSGSALIKSIHKSIGHRQQLSVSLIDFSEVRYFTVSAIDTTTVPTGVPSVLSCFSETSQTYSDYMSAEHAVSRMCAHYVVTLKHTQIF